MGRAVGVELGELIGELSEEPLAGPLEAADAAHVLNLYQSPTIPSALEGPVLPRQHGTGKYFDKFGANLLINGSLSRRGGAKTF